MAWTDVRKGIVMGERWKPVKGYEGRYEVSDRGRIRSPNYRRRGKPGILAQAQDRDGYPMITLWHSRGVNKTKKVHTLVLEAFTRPRPKGMLCDHIDSNVKNNRHDNLEWVTPQQNVLRGRAPEVNAARIGSKNFAAKMSERKVYNLRRQYASGGITHQGLADKYGLHRRTVTKILRRFTWKHVADAL